MATVAAVDKQELETRVKEMYRDVAVDPHQEFHFETGRALAERLGYDPVDLDTIPPAAIDSFAGVGCYFEMADIKEGESVLDLGSGSGMDVFVAALKAGASGSVTGIDMTDAQLQKADRLRAEAGFDNVSFKEGHIEQLPIADGCIDVVISNGVINLSPDKERVFQEAARVLRPGGRLVFSDIASDRQLPEGVTCDASLWAACIGGAMQRDSLCETIEAAGLQIEELVENPRYEFISDQAQGATQKYGVKSISILAEKPLEQTS